MVKKEWGILSKRKYKFLILLKEGKYFVETEVFKTINKTGKCRTAYKYTFNGQKYEIEFDLEIKERG